MRNETLCHHLSVREEIARVRGKENHCDRLWQGYGEATFLAYVRAGAKVVGMDIDRETGQQAADAASALARDAATFIPVDVADADSVNSAFDEAVEWLGGELHILAHPAAIQAASDPSTVSASEWDRMFAVNVRGTMLTNQAAHRHMKVGGGGSIINFGSISGQRSEPGAVAYSAPRGRSLLDALSCRRSGKGWRQSQRYLARHCDPDVPRGHVEDEPSEETASFWMNHQSIALGQTYGDATKDLAPVMVFFASDDSGFITGQLIPVDGGQTTTR